MAGRAPSWGGPGLGPQYSKTVLERRTQAERRDESRKRLILAAMRLLGERGYARTSLVEIGREAGLSRGLVSHYFGSKEACMRAVVEYIRTQTRQRTSDLGGHGEDAVDVILDVYFDQVRAGHVEAKAMYVVLIEGLTATPGLRPAVADTNALTRTFLAECVAEMVDPRIPDPATHPQVMAIATLIEGILRGVALQWMADPDNVDLDAAKNTAKMMVRSAVTAIETVADLPSK
ncbi:TetR family transcriptional regulator [Actinomadura sp. LD22]|uniref:TetR family transcriptional regulator n=1 Tax=Actinomadura physcomitrii TaxID=2650748 RepID=A0A6I4MB12_9ACTN|nr:TetR family transcriptional regulator [Actinomadura physcomitrii]MWA01595.1 TetR family transcriptional regulator [Actinomadura physcomitrii]